MGVAIEGFKEGKLKPAGAVAYAETIEQLSGCSRWIVLFESKEPRGFSPEKG